ncbi:MAG: class II aldolase/adducin family protein [Syntrophomonadaceae bacterium]|jgi:L-fuculose-phosphate aldolase|nr:class II aldolase/adducin family protein [Syntrophomonadaceae bacterium]
MTLYPSERNARIMILKISAWMQERGYLKGNDACISCRVDPNQILTLATGVYKGYLDEDMILKLSVDKGEVLYSFGSYTPSADVEMHLRVFREYPMVYGTINAQPPYATLCALQPFPLVDALTPSAVCHLGIVPLVHYAAPGSEELANAIAKACKGYNALLLENRGVLVWGANLFETWQRLETVEQYAFQTWMFAQADRKPSRLQRAEVENLLKERERYCLYRGGAPCSRA